MNGNDGTLQWKLLQLLGFPRAWRIIPDDGRTVCNGHHVEPAHGHALHGRLEREKKET